MSLAPSIHFSGNDLTQTDPGYRAPSRSGVSRQLIILAHLVHLIEFTGIEIAQVGLI